MIYSYHQIKYTKKHSTDRSYNKGGKMGALISRACESKIPLVGFEREEESDLITDARP